MYIIVVSRDMIIIKVEKCIANISSYNVIKIIVLVVLQIATR